MLRPDFCKLALVTTLTVLCVSLTLKAETAPSIQYDKSAEVKITGVIDDVKTSADHIVHLNLRSSNGAMDVFVAPEKFLKKMEIFFDTGQTIEVLGSQCTVEGKSVLLMREVTRNGDVMTIRDEEGKPVWVGWIE